MNIPRYWSRASEGDRACLGWSDASLAEAQALSRERLAKVLERRNASTPADWDYYPARPVKEEILGTPSVPGARVVVTRNRAGAEVLNTDHVAFVDIDFPQRSGARAGLLGGLFRRKAEPVDSPETAALERVQAWVETAHARVRAYRTAAGLRLIRLDALVDPASDECARMFAALATDEQYSRLCRIQKSFRARLTPKPHRVGCSPAPCSHPRTDPQAVRSFDAWLREYVQASADRSVCTFVAEYGGARPIAAAQAVVELHDLRTLVAGGALA